MIKKLRQIKHISHFLIGAIFLVALATFLPGQVKAGLSFNGGEYTNLCGTGTAATGYSCPANCDINSGTCSGSFVYRFTCDGRQTDCRSNEQGPSGSQSLGNPGSNKTVQLDVFNKNCRDGSGSWVCGDGDMTGYITWFSGQAQAPTPTPPPPAQPVCNTISLAASPSSVNPGKPINFTINGDASTFVGDNFDGGASNCSGSWNNQTCTAGNTPGTFTWTHTWKRCVGDINTCSGTCTATKQFNVAAAPVPVQKGAVGGRVWEDLDNNQTINGAERPLPGMSVFLDSTANSMTTNAQGFYVFRNIAPGAHRVFMLQSDLDAGNWILSTGLPISINVQIVAGHQANAAFGLRHPVVTPTITPTVTPTITPTVTPTLTPVPGAVAQCPNGFVFGGIVGSNIICNSLNQDQRQSQSASADASTGPITITVANPAPAAGGTSTSVLGVSQLPKTGLPMAAWALSGLLPAGLGLKKFGSSVKDASNAPHFLAQMRNFLKES